MGETVAVTGATGFIGSAVVRALLREGRDVRALVEPGASPKHLDDIEPALLAHLDRATVDVCDYVGMARALDGCGSLFHLAAIYRLWMEDPSLIYRVNLEGTTTALLAARAAKVGRIVYTASIAAVGLRPGREPADETDAFNLHGIASDYILTKHLSERIALRFAESGMPIVVVNPAFPFGPRDSAPTPTGSLILAHLRGQVPAVGEGGFCAIDVDDCAAGHLAAEKKGRVGERYILGNHNVTFEEFSKLVCDVAGISAPKLRIPGIVGQAYALGLELWADHVSHQPPLATLRSVKYMQEHAFFDATKARRELDLPQTPLADSVRRAIDYFRSAGMV